jgi:hypothetical protein
MPPFVLRVFLAMLPSASSLDMTALEAFERCGQPLTNIHREGQHIMSPLPLSTKRKYMKIKRSRWHYRLLNWFTEGNVPTNLCSYFWNLIGRLIFILMLSGVALGALYAAVKYWQQALLTAGFILGLTLIIIGSFYLGEWLRGRRKSKPGLVMSFLKAKKDKVCPLLEFE